MVLRLASRCLLAHFYVCLLLTPSGYTVRKCSFEIYIESVESSLVYSTVRYLNGEKYLRAIYSSTFTRALCVAGPGLNDWSTELRSEIGRHSLSIRAVSLPMDVPKS